MSANYSIWHGWRSDERTIELLATAINVQELGRGSQEFIAMLMEDLGHGNIAIDTWKVSEPFAVNYLSSGTSGNWRDSWLLTWAVSIVTNNAPRPPIEPVDMTIWDSSWDGVEATPTYFEIVATGDSPMPDLAAIDDVVTRRCPLEHVHATVPVRDSGPGPAAELAELVNRLFASEGWATDHRASRR